jgi:hypothetical protein
LVFAALPDREPLLSVSLLPTGSRQDLPIKAGFFKEKSFTHGNSSNPDASGDDHQAQ